MSLDICLDLDSKAFTILVTLSLGYGDYDLLY